MNKILYLNTLCHDILKSKLLCTLQLHALLLFWRLSTIKNLPTHLRLESTCYSKAQSSCKVKSN